MKIVFATNNAHKLREVQQTVGDKFEIVSLRECGVVEDIPENEPTLEGNALAKARYIYSRTGLSCFADDTGLEVDALGGEPGVRSARYATDGHDDEANKRLLLERMQGVEARGAQFRTAIAFIIGGKDTGQIGLQNHVILRQTGHQPQHISIHRRRFPVKANGANSAGSVGTDAHIGPLFRLR